VRGAYGLFYDHPLLAVAFNSDIADGSQQQQFTTVLRAARADGLIKSFADFPGNGCARCDTRRRCQRRISKRPTAL
jgi:hypothetical protein